MAVPNCRIDERSRQYDELRRRWIWALELEIDQAGRYVARRTRWYVLVDEDYPLGSIAVHPASDLGLSLTFQHQERNGRAPNGRAWRDGKLCLDSPLRSPRRSLAVRDPVGDTDLRLRWHIERALDWVAAAAAGTLVEQADPYELPPRPSAAPPDRSTSRIVHDESNGSFPAWKEHINAAGTVTLARPPAFARVLAIARFLDRSGRQVRAWSGRSLGESQATVTGHWWLWPGTIVVGPWHVPSTWGELRRAGKSMGVDVDARLKQLVSGLRGAKERGVLLLGYPIPRQIG